MKRAVLTVFFSILGIGFLFSYQEYAEEKLLADFVPNTKIVSEGGVELEYGSWNRFPNDSTQKCYTENIEDYNALDKWAVRIVYDVDSKNPAYNGFWLKLGGADFTDYNALLIRIKGDSDAGYPETISLELKDAYNTSPYKISGISSEWKEYVVPFSYFFKIKDWSDMREFVIIFNDLDTAPKNGAVLIDKISVVKV